MIPRTISSFTKNIGMNTIYGSIDDPRLEGHVFSVIDSFNPFDDPNHVYSNVGSAKKYLEIITGPSELKFTRLPYMSIISRSLYLQTESSVNCFDDGLPKPMKTKIYIKRKNLIRNFLSFGKLFPFICVEQNGIQKFGNGVIIKGPCNIIFDKTTNHSFGGRVRIETDSEVEFAKTRRFLNVS
jgi:hypothetical protein